MTFPRHRWLTILFLVGACVVLTILWLPGLQFPIVSDAAAYGLLGRSMWEHGTYWLFGAPYAKQLPFHAVTSYPFTAIFGFHVGMKVATLVAGWAVLLFTYLLISKTFSRNAAMIAVIGVLFQPSFILMTQLGSADLLFTFLFLAAALFFIKAEQDQRFYILAAIAAGCMCLARYNGLPVLPFFAIWILRKRRGHLISPIRITALVIGVGIVSIWFIRNWITFGNPFYTEYSGELAAEAPNHVAQLISNIFYYGNPIHNILPFFLIFALYGLWKEWKKQIFLMMMMAGVLALTAIWWVQAMRFAFPGYVILMGFAAAGILHAYGQVGRWANIFVVGCVIIFLGTHLPAICLYTYGQCNAAFDRTIGGLPKNLGLTSEGFYATTQARAYFNAHAETGALLLTEEPLGAIVMKEGGWYRPDIVIQEDSVLCGAYRLTQRPYENEEILFSTKDAPVTVVARSKCK